MASRRLQKKEEGFALVSVMLVMTFLLTVVSGLLVFSQVSVRYAKFQQQRAQAFYLAESGINHALHAMRISAASLPQVLPTDDTTAPSLSATLDSGTYRVWYYSSDGKKRLRSEGNQDGVTRTVEIEIGSGSLFPRDIVEIGDGPYVPTPAFPPMPTPPDSWNPALDDYGTSEYYSRAIIRDNTIGPAYITRPQTLHVYNELDPSEPAISLNNLNGDLIIGRDDATEWETYDIYVWGDIELRNQAAIRIKEKAIVTFWVSGNVYLGNSTEVVTGLSILDPANTYPRFFIRGSLTIRNANITGNGSDRPLVFFMDTHTSGSVDVIMENSAKLYGAIYAPTRDVELNNKAYIEGSVVGRSVSVNQSATVIYEGRDDLITLPDSEAGGATFTAGTWKEIRP